MQLNVVRVERGFPSQRESTIAEVVAISFVASVAFKKLYLQN